MKNKGIKSLVQYGDVLKKEVNNSLYNYAISQEDLFVKYYVKRMPKVLFAKDFKDYIPYFDKFLRKCFAEVCQCLKIEPFKIHDIELYLSSYNDRDRFEHHNDKTENRMISFVYYFHSPVKKFTGGELLLPENGRLRIEPANNTIVFFNPSLSHEVLPISCPGKKFKDGRFSVSGWLMKEPKPKSKRKNVKK